MTVCDAAHASTYAASRVSSRGGADEVHPSSSALPFPSGNPEQRGQREQEQQRQQSCQGKRGSEQAGPLRQRAHAHHRKATQRGNHKVGRHHLGLVFRWCHLINGGRTAHGCQTCPHAPDCSADEKVGERRQGQPGFDKGQTQEQQEPPASRARRLAKPCPSSRERAAAL